MPRPKHSAVKCELSIVVPVLNEEESVPALLQAIGEVFDGQPPGTSWELILVDDGSQDGTCRVAAGAAEQLNLPLRIISLQRNFGQTAAMQAGFDAAQGRLIATLDGDLQNDPADIPMMLEHFEANDLDLLVGRRANRQDGFFLRLIPSWIANRLIAKVTGVKIRDYGCSLKIYRTSVIRQVRLMGEMHRFIPAWVAKVTATHRIGEIDVRHHPRLSGQSKYGISRTIRVFLDLIAVLYFMKYRARPGHFFGSMGLFVGALGAVMLTSVFVSKFMFGQDIGTRPMLLIGAFAAFSGLQLTAFGLLAEMMTRIYHESANRPTYVVRDTHGTSDAVDSALVPYRRAG